MTDVVQALRAARRRAERIYGAAGYRNVYVNGARAALRGKSRDDCPYARGRSTWRQAWRNAWLAGFNSITKEEEV